MKYKIVFRGKIKSDIPHDQILENLSELFDESKQEIHQKFFNMQKKELTLISDLNSQDAEEYKAALSEAGIIADIDVDFDENLDFGEWLDNQDSKDKPSKEQVDPVTKITIDLPEEPIIEKDQRSSDIRKRFLEAQDFTLEKTEADMQTGEVDRVEKLKKITRKKEDDIIINDSTVVAIPPLFDSGVRVGRVRFIYRITLAFAILMTCLNVLPIYLYDLIGSSSVIVTIFLTVAALVFVLIVITQRLCDLDNLSFGKMAFVTIILCTLFLSIMINDYYALNAEKISFAKQFLKSNMSNPNFFILQNTLNEYLVSDTGVYLLKKIDSIVKWFVYVVVFFGAIALFALPGIKGNNQYGGPSGVPTAKSTAFFIISLVIFFYSISYPYGTKELRAQHRLYQGLVYESLGLLKPLPSVYETAYIEYLEKKSTK